MSRFLISVVMPTRNRSDIVGRAVSSVLANVHPSFEVVVVDQSDDDATGEIVRGLAQRDPRLRYLHTLPPGLSRAYNVGVRATNGAIVAFTDDDCVAPVDWIATVEAVFADQRVDMLYGQVLLPDALRGAAGTVPTLPIEKPALLGPGHGFRIYGMGANFALRRALFDRLDGFDEVLGGGGPLRSSQDFDFQFRAYRAGALVRLSPEVRVDHYGVRTNEEWPRTLRAYGVGDGAFYFKHVRCGDLLALTLLAKRLMRTATREALRFVRRRPSNAAYLVACLEGIRDSLRYRVDRRTRMYLRPARGGGA